MMSAFVSCVFLLAVLLGVGVFVEIRSIWREINGPLP